MTKEKSPAPVAPTAAAPRAATPAQATPATPMLTITVPNRQIVTPAKPTPPPLRRLSPTAASIEPPVLTLTAPVTSTTPPVAPALAKPVARNLLPAFNAEREMSSPPHIRRQVNSHGIPDLDVLLEEAMINRARAARP